MNKLKTTLFILLLFLLWTGGPSLNAEERRPTQQHEIVTAKPAARQVILTGFTRARHVMDIVNEEAGRCEKVTADVGDVVGKDGLFISLDTTFIDLAIDKNAVRQSQLENRIAYHRKEVKRHQNLVARATAAQSTLDNFQNQLDQATFELQTLRLEEVNLKERRKRHFVKIPSGWIIMERFVEPGEWLPVGTLLGRAGDFGTLMLPLALAPSELHALETLGTPFTIRFPHPGAENLLVEAAIERISPAFDAQTRKIAVDLIVRRGLPVMRGGLRAELTLTVSDASDIVLVPESALEERYEEFWLTRPNGQKVRVVFLGRGPGDTARVRSLEIKPGDTFKALPEG